jgi:lipopolysaccharide export system protein LptA
MRNSPRVRVSSARVAANGRPPGEESSANARTTRRSGLLADRTRAASRNHRGLLFSFSLVLLAAAAIAQAPPEPDYFDIRADRSELKKIGDETVIELADNVRIVHGDVTVTADRGISFSERHLTQLFGHVRVEQGTMVMTGEEGEYRQIEDLAILRRRVRIVEREWQVECDEVRYSRLTGKAWLLGRVEGRDSTSTIRADRLLYERDIGRAEAFGSVEIANRDEGVVVRGRHGVYYRARGEGIVDRDPQLISGPDEAEPVVVVADTMHVFPDSSRASAHYRVKITKGTTITQCDSAMLYDDRQIVELFGRPLARQDNVWMKGERMVAFYDEKEVHRIDILGAAEIREVPRDTLVVGRDNWIRGDSISLYLRENDIDSVRVTGHATSEYHPVTPGKVEANRIEGDRMYFRFGGEEVDWVDVAGHAAGVYRYLDLAEAQTADSLRAVNDTTLAYVPFDRKAQRVAYAAERIQYDARQRDLMLHRSARLTYRDSELVGETITYHSTLQILDATGNPVLTEGGQKMYGERMDYDLESETGLITSGNTKYEQGYYSGENLAKVGENELKVWNSWYTTCDLKTPHYHFAARTMKVYPDDKVFTGPIWLHVGKTPIFALPFMANSISRGRRSGFLRPDIEFGVTGEENRFIRGLGYYWATNDYTDFTVVADFEEDVRWRLHVDNRYALRYRFTGGANFNYVRESDGSGSEWTLDESHAQTLGEKATLNANLRFVSSDDAPQNVNTIDDVNRYIDRSIRSNVSLRKSWESVGFSASATRAQNLNITDPDAVKVEMTAPDVTLSIQPHSLYFGSDAGPPEGLWDSLLKNTRYSPALAGGHRRTEKLFQTTDITTGRAGLGFSSPQRLKFVTVSPSLNMSLVSTRFDQSIDAHERYVQSGSVVDTVQVAALDSTRTTHEFSWNVGASANTNFYGTFYPRIGRLRGIRHTLTPAASYQFTPERVNRPRGQSVGLSLRNSLDLKVAAKDTTETGEEGVRKISSVVLWSLSTTYTPDRPVETAWSNISSAVNFTLFGMNVSVNHLIDPYDLDVLNTSATSGLVIRGTHPFGKSSKVGVEELNPVAQMDTTRGRDLSGSGVEFVQRDEYGMERKIEPSLALEEGRLPWSVNLGLSYSKSSSGTVSSTLRVGWDVQLTDHWRIDYSTIYDVEGRAMNGQNFRITRDLHCWEMSLARQQLGDEWEFYFRIALKAHPELYGESGNRGLGGGLIGQF